MKRYEKIFEDIMKFSSVRPIDDISEVEKQFFYKAMEESAWEAWQCFGLHKSYFKRWWDDEERSNKRPDDLTTNANYL